MTGVEFSDGPPPWKPLKITSDSNKIWSIITMQSYYVSSPCNESLHGSSPLILGGDLKISDQNNWGGEGVGGTPEQKIKFGGHLKF